jgi:hypothetical protein
VQRWAKRRRSEKPWRSYVSSPKLDALRRREAEMSFRIRTPQPMIHVNVISNSGHGHRAVTVGVSVPVTPERMKLLHRLVGSESWDKQSASRKVTWEEVEAIVAGHVGKAE